MATSPLAIMVMATSQLAIMVMATTVANGVVLYFSAGRHGNPAIAEAANSVMALSKSV